MVDLLRADLRRVAAVTADLRQAAGSVSLRAAAMVAAAAAVPGSDRRAASLLRAAR
jgi:hypothetical protein